MAGWGILMLAMSVFLMFLYSKRMEKEERREEAQSSPPTLFQYVIDDWNDWGPKQDDIKPAAEIIAETAAAPEARPETIFPAPEQEEDIYGLRRAEIEQAQREASPLYQAYNRRQEERQAHNGLLLLGGLILLVILLAQAYNQGQNSAQQANEAYMEDYE